MAQPSSFTPQYYQGNTAVQQPGNSNPFVVVNQQPSRRETFPYSLSVKGILVFSIFKCIIGSLLFFAGLANVIVMRYEVTIAFGIWCGLTILANGIIGCVLKCKQNKCLIGAFLGLSITSLIFDVSILSFYSVVLEYFINFNNNYCYYGHYGYYCIRYLSSGAISTGIGLSSFLLSMAVCELACSIGSVILSGKAYCKCCNTCDVNDCCTCLGCCECSIVPLNAEQNRQRFVPAYYSNQNTQMSSAPPHSYEYNSYRPQANTVVQNPAAYNVQGGPQNNPCSGLMNFVINIPAYLFGGTNGPQLSAINVNVQAVPFNHQNPVTNPDGSARQVHVMTTAGTEQNPASTTWQQMDT